MCHPRWCKGSWRKCTGAASEQRASEIALPKPKTPEALYPNPRTVRTCFGISCSFQVHRESLGPGLRGLERSVRMLGCRLGGSGLGCLASGLRVWDLG